MAAILGVVVIALLIAALAVKHWFKLHGGKCNKTYIGVYQFLTVGIEKDPGECDSLSSSFKKICVI